MTLYKYVINNVLDVFNKQILSNQNKYQTLRKLILTGLLQIQFVFYNEVLVCHQHQYLP